MCVCDRDISEKPTPPSSLLHSHCLFFNPSSPSVLDKIDHYHWKNGEIRDKKYGDTVRKVSNRDSRIGLNIS